MKSKLFRNKEDSAGRDFINGIFGTKKIANTYLATFFVIMFLVPLFLMSQSEVVRTIASFVFLLGCLILGISFFYRYNSYKKRKHN